MNDTSSTTTAATIAGTTPKECEYGKCKELEADNLQPNPSIWGCPAIRRSAGRILSPKPTAPETPVASESPSSAPRTHHSRTDERLDAQDSSNGSIAKWQVNKSGSHLADRLPMVYTNYRRPAGWGGSCRDWHNKSWGKSGPDDSENPEQLRDIASSPGVASPSQQSINPPKPASKVNSFGALASEVDA